MLENKNNEFLRIEKLENGRWEVCNIFYADSKEHLIHILRKFQSNYLCLETKTVCLKSHRWTNNMDGTYTFVFYWNNGVKETFRLERY